MQSCCLPKSSGPFSPERNKALPVEALLLRNVDVEGRPTGTTVVAADAVGAGVGEMVLYASGSSARQTVATDKRPVDAVVMAIVDQWEVGGETKYKK